MRRHRKAGGRFISKSQRKRKSVRWKRRHPGPTRMQLRRRPEGESDGG